MVVRPAVFAPVDARCINALGVGSLEEAGGAAAQIRSIAKNPEGLLMPVRLEHYIVVEGSHEIRLEAVESPDDALVGCLRKSQIHRRTNRFHARLSVEILTRFVAAAVVYDHDPPERSRLIDHRGQSALEKLQAVAVHDDRHRSDMSVSVHDQADDMLLLA